MQRHVCNPLLASLLAPLLVLAAAAAPARADASGSDIESRAHASGSESESRADAHPEAAWCGKFAYVGGSSQEAAIRRAIEQAISDMGPLSRHVARLRLSQETRPDPRLRIVVDEREVGVAAQEMWKSPLDGTVRVVRDADGEAYRVSHQLEGRRLYQIIRDESLVIRNVFALSEDGRSLDIRVNVTHERIPEPLAYRLTYRRVD